MIETDGAINKCIEYLEEQIMDCECGNRGEVVKILNQDRVFENRVDFDHVDPIQALNECFYIDWNLSGQVKLTAAKWGVYGRTKIKYAILILNPSKHTFRYVTDADCDGWKSERGKKAMLFDSLELAQDRASGICLTGLPAFVTEVPNIWRWDSDFVNKREYNRKEKKNVRS